MPRSARGFSSTISRPSLKSLTSACSRALRSRAAALTVLCCSSCLPRPITQGRLGLPNYRSPCTTTSTVARMAGVRAELRLGVASDGSDASARGPHPTRIRLQDAAVRGGPGGRAWASWQRCGELSQPEARLRTDLLALPGRCQPSHSARFPQRTDVREMTDGDDQPMGLGRPRAVWGSALIRAHSGRQRMQSVSSFRNWCPTGRFGAPKSKRWMSLMGRLHPATSTDGLPQSGRRRTAPQQDEQASRNNWRPPVAELCCGASRTDSAPCGWCTGRS